MNRSPPKMLILSPHMDDVVIDCFDHAQLWKRQFDIRLLTLFSAFPAQQKILPETALEYMRQSGFSDAKKFSTQRHREDDQAMQKLGIKYQRLELSDASFRIVKNKDQYSSFGSIFKGKISLYDQKIFDELVSVLATYADYEVVVIPLGIGNHIDHVLTRKAAEKIFPAVKLRYYRDYPYGIRNRRFKDLLLKRRELSRISTSFQKRAAIECYSSQLKLLFPTTVTFDEIIYKCKKNILKELVAR